MGGLTWSPCCMYYSESYNIKFMILWYGESCLPWASQKCVFTEGGLFMWLNQVMFVERWSLYGAY